MGNRASRAIAILCLLSSLLLAPRLLAQTQTQGNLSDPPPPDYPARQAPLISLDSLSFLEGTWQAGTRDGKTELGTYTFVRQLDRHLLTRTGFGDDLCVTQTTSACKRGDLFYVFQDSPGAPLKAIYFDSEGRVIRYTVEISHTEVARDRLDLVVFSSDLADFGPRYRLVYERNTDTLTGRASMKGSFETLLPNNIWHPYLEWVGVKR